jgi:hypothetical protein
MSIGHIDKHPSPTAGDDCQREVERRIAQAIRGIHFGAVEIVIHEGRVVQIERKERLRFDRINPAHQPTGGH